MPPRFFTRNGVVHPITPRKRGGFMTAAAVGVVVSLAGGGLGGAGAADGAGLSGSALRAKAARSQPAARRGRRDEAWRRMSLKRTTRRIVRTERRALRCAARSFGQVRVYFLRTPCRALHRMLVVVGDGHGNDLALAVAWVRMPSAGRARRFKELEDRYGTGDITPIAGALLNLAGLRFTGHHYASHRTGSLTVVAETEPVAGHPTDDLLKAVADVAVWFPAPVTGGPGRRRSG